MKTTAVLLIIAAISGLWGCTNSPPPESTPPLATTPEFRSAPDQKSACAVAGCSRELCVTTAEAQDLMTTCHWEEEFKCRQMMTCELQSDGKCGFTSNEESQKCLKDLSEKAVM